VFQIRAGRKRAGCSAVIAANGELRAFYFEISPKGASVALKSRGMKNMPGLSPDRFDVRAGANFFIFRYQRGGQFAGSGDTHAIGRICMKFAGQGGRLDDVIRI
jgi:hypothetical protein